MNKLIDFEKIEPLNVDVVIGFGETCRVAEALKRNKLRYFSSPFDWMMNYKLDSVVEILKSVITGNLQFFNNCYEDKKYAEKNCTGIIDSDTGMISMHDFPINMDIKKAPEFFYLKYINRFKKLNNLLKQANKVCFLTNRNISIEELKTFVNSMKQLYKFKQIYFINIFDTNKEFFEKIEEQNVAYLIYHFNDEHINGREKATNPDFWKGKTEYWDKILNKISLNNRFTQTYKIKKFIFNISTDVSDNKFCTIITILGINLRFRISL